MTAYVYEILDPQPDLQESYALALGAAEVAPGLLEGVVDGIDRGHALDRLMEMSEQAGLPLTFQVCIEEAAHVA